MMQGFHSIARAAIRCLHRFQNIRLTLAQSHQPNPYPESKNKLLLFALAFSLRSNGFTPKNNSQICSHIFFEHGMTLIRKPKNSKRTREGDSAAGHNTIIALDSKIKLRGKEQIYRNTLLTSKLLRTMRNI